MTHQDLKALRHGERSAQEQFLRRHAQRIFALVFRMVRCTEDAEELTQDIMLKALQHINDYDPGRATIDTWLAHIAYHTALNHLRKSQPPTISLDDDENHAAQVSDKAVARAFQEADTGMTELLRQALTRLTPEEQTLVTLFYDEDLPLRDIAYITGLTPTAAGTRLHRIRKKLYTIIKTLQST